MFQKFFTDTIMSKFIKGLLSNTNIPLFNFVKNGDYVLKDAIYIYKHWIIKCTVSGTLFIEDTKVLQSSQEIISSSRVTPGADFSPASIKILAHYSNESSSKYNYSYKSSISYYDSETHKHLGNYLRFLRDKEDLNLMMYYNCYNYYMIDEISLSKNFTDTSTQELVTWKPETLSGYKLAAVPIKFDKQYTIAIDCPTEVLMRAVIYGPSGMIKESFSSDVYYSDTLTHSGKIYAQLQYKNPILYSIHTDHLQTFQREKYLYLLIQLPESCNSAITVLEGTYNFNSMKIRQQREAYSNAVWNAAREPNSEGILQPPGQQPSLDIPKNVGEYSLLSINPQESYAFSDRLIEYLLHNIITHREELSRNIEKVQRILYEIDDDYRACLVGNLTSYGVWDDYIKDAVIRLMHDYNNTALNKRINSVYGIYLRDMDGYINKDVEEFFMRLGGYKLDGSNI